MISRCWQCSVSKKIAGHWYCVATLLKREENKLSSLEYLEHFILLGQIFLTVQRVDTFKTTIQLSCWFWWPLTVHRSPRALISTWSLFDLFSVAVGISLSDTWNNLCSGPTEIDNDLVKLASCCHHIKLERFYKLNYKTLLKQKLFYLEELMTSGIYLDSPLIIPTKQS